MTVPRVLIGGRVSHKRKGQPYAHGCNRESIRDASRKRGIVGIDLDINPNKQLTPWVHHQLHPTKRDAWFDPKHLIGDGQSCRDLTDAQMKRFRVRYQGRLRPMLTAHQAAMACANVRGGLIPCFEAKFVHACYFDPEWWHREFVVGWGANLHPVIMTLPGAGNVGLRKLAAAHEAGLPTMWLWRGSISTATLKGHGVDLVKSRPRHPIYAI